MTVLLLKVLFYAFYASLVGFVAIQIADVLTTNKGLANGAVEKGKVALYFQQHWGRSWWLYKVAYVAPLAYGEIWFVDHWRIISGIFLIANIYSVMSMWPIIKENHRLGTQP